MNETIKKNGIKFGLISAVISIVVTVLMYVIDINLFANSYIGIGMVFFYLILGIYIISTTKKERKSPFSSNVPDGCVISDFFNHYDVFVAPPEDLPSTV